MAGSTIFPVIDLVGGFLHPVSTLHDPFRGPQCATYPRPHISSSYPGHLALNQADNFSTFYSTHLPPKRTSEALLPWRTSTQLD